MLFLPQSLWTIRTGHTPSPPTSFPPQTVHWGRFLFPRSLFLRSATTSSLHLTLGTLPPHLLPLPGRAGKGSNDSTALPTRRFPLNLLSFNTQKPALTSPAPLRAALNLFTLETPVVSLANLQFLPIPHSSPRHRYRIASRCKPDDQLYRRRRPFNHHMATLAC